MTQSRSVSRYVSHKGANYIIKEAGDEGKVSVDGRQCTVRASEEKLKAADPCEKSLRTSSGAGAHAARLYWRAPAAPSDSREMPRGMRRRRPHTVRPTGLRLSAQHRSITPATCSWLGAPSATQPDTRLRCLLGRLRCLLGRLRCMLGRLRCMLGRLRCLLGRLGPAHVAPR